jgi:hypothetical protein
MWHNVKQNTEDPCPCCGKTWGELRTGKVTGSSIAKVMANFGKAFGDPAKKLALQIAVHELGGKPSSNEYTNHHMQRGHEQEPIARRLYEETYFCTVGNGGFYDNGRTGVSPDGHPDGDGLIEIKCVEEPAHYACLKRKYIDPTYKWQVVFELFQSNSTWIDYVSYCPYFPPEKELIVYRFTQHDFNTEHQMMHSRLKKFFKMVDGFKDDITRMK